MIRYTALWRRDVEGELAQIWCDATNRAEISAAANQIEIDLAVDPHQKGEPSAHDSRSFTSGLITVNFRVDEGDRKVFVEGIRLT
jgi:hypothetical protein